MSSFSESIVEAAALGWFRELEWATGVGPEIAPGMPATEREDYDRVVLEQRLRNALERLNPGLPAEALEDAYRRLIRPEGSTIEVVNRAVHRMLVDGVTTEYRRPDGSLAGAQVRVLDFDRPENNDWFGVNQFTVIENKHNRRPDLVLFVNGLPLALLELKNAAAENATIWSAYNQVQTYKRQIPSLFAYNALLVVSDWSNGS